MNNRDKSIMESLGKFKVLDRDQLISLHFGNLNQKEVTCNRVMKRLRDRGLVDCNLNIRPYNYFLNPTPIRKDSGKLFHYKRVADFYIEAKSLGSVSDYEVEPLLGGKGTVEPDLFMLWNKAPFFVEVQTSNHYSKTYMSTKLKKYLEYYQGGAWKEAVWQREKPFFPYILIITDKPYNLDKMAPLKIFQAKSMEDFMKRYAKK